MTDIIYERKQKFQINIKIEKKKTKRNADTSQEKKSKNIRVLFYSSFNSQIVTFG